MRRVSASITAFRDPYIITNIINSDDFSSVDARRLRYSLYWAYYENTAYRQLQAHMWATQYKTDYGLYKYIRNIRNPAGRLGDFWQTHLMGGVLDPMAGAGKIIPSALPIITENEALRPAISKLWEWSNWQQKKDLYTLNGSTMGDTFIKVVDNVAKEKVMFEIVEPATISWLEKDDFGHVRGYIIEEERQHPTVSSRVVLYSEQVTRIPNSDDVLFETFLDGQPFAWSDEHDDTEWTEPYGFIPMVHVPNIDVGDKADGWGWAEMHKGRQKFNEIDDMQSKLDDQIRKTVDSVWFGSGFTAKDIEVTGATPTAANPQPGREENKIIASGKADAKLMAMVADLDIPGVNETIEQLENVIERDYPELQLDSALGGNVSGETLRELRRKSESKVNMRRPAYDRGEVHAQQMAIAIAGFRGYDPAFASFNLDSFAKGDLQHFIGQRDVFGVDELAQLEANKVLWETAARAVEKTGVSLEAFLEVSGVPKETIDIVRRSGRRSVVNGARTTARNAARNATTPPTQPEAQGNDTAQDDFPDGDEGTV